VDPDPSTDYRAVFRARRTRLDRRFPGRREGVGRPLRAVCVASAPKSCLIAPIRRASRARQPRPPSRPQSCPVSRPSSRLAQPGDPAPVRGDPP